MLSYPMNNEKAKRGKPAGSTSTVSIRFGDLKRYLPIGDDTIMQVGTTWLKNLGIQVESLGTIAPRVAASNVVLATATPIEQIKTAEIEKERIEVADMW